MATKDKAPVVRFEATGLGYSTLGKTEDEARAAWVKESGSEDQEHCVVHQVMRLG